VLELNPGPTRPAEPAKGCREAAGNLSGVGQRESCRVVDRAKLCLVGLVMDDQPNAPPTPRQYVEQIVLPTLREFLTACDDRRRAYLACLVICHCADITGLAEAATAPGFAALRGRPRRHALNAATKAVQDEMRQRCGGMFDVVQGIANGTKHPGRLPLLPWTERNVRAFAWGEPGAGCGQGRWGGPGLALDVDGGLLCLDEFAQQVLGAYICAYPIHLGSVGLSFMDFGPHVPGLALEGTWLGEILAWARSRPEVAEVWLFGSRAKGTARPDSDVDLGIVLVPGSAGHDWPLGNWMSPSNRSRDELQGCIGRHVSLELFSRPGEEQSEEEVAARAPAILLWTRTAATRTGS